MSLLELGGIKGQDLMPVDNTVAVDQQQTVGKLHTQLGVSCASLQHMLNASFKISF